LSRAYPRREQLFPPEGVSPLHRSFQIPHGHPAIWRGVDPAACESPLRALRRGCEKNGCVTLGSKPKFQMALRWETPASSSSGYRLLQNGTPRQALHICAGTSSPASNRSILLRIGCGLCVCNAMSELGQRRKSALPTCWSAPPQKADIAAVTAKVS